jgi:very-short-patch-repair endonuclease
MSDLEEQFAFQLRVSNHPEPTREYRFAPPRRWRFDFAWIEAKVGVEVNGGAWVNGRHNRAGGQAADNEKLNAAVLAGWRILRFTSDAVADGSALQQTEELLAVRSKAVQL